MSHLDGSINLPLYDIITKKNFLNRDELKKLVDQKTGIDVSKNILKPSKIKKTASKKASQNRCRKSYEKLCPKQQK